MIVQCKTVIEVSLTKFCLGRKMAQEGGRDLSCISGTALWEDVRGKRWQAVVIGEIAQRAELSRSWKAVKGLKRQAIANLS